MYNSLQYKTKQFLFLLVKLTIIVGALYFIYNKVVHNEQLEFSVFIEQLEATIFNNYGTLFTLFVFSFLNWFFEIIKWQTLASFVHKTSFISAAKQSLGSLTASLFTPNRIGEYGAKAVYFKKGNRRKIMLMNLVSNSTQMLITTVFGIVGLLYFFTHYTVEIEVFRLRRAAYLVMFLIAFVFLGKKIGYKKIRGFYIDKIIRFLKEIPFKTHFKTVFFSAIRYLIFSHQFYYLLLIFNIQIDYTTAMSFISSMYLLASLVPSLSFFDWLIKGSVALWVFSFVGNYELVVVTISLVMWALNFGIPAIFGSYFVLNFSFATTTNTVNSQQ